MTNMIGLVSLIIIITALSVAMVCAIILAFKLKKSQSLLIQANIDKTHALQKLSEARTQIESKNLEQTDGFVRFISESRDWAFNYIEDVQNSIQELQTAVESGYPTEEKMAKLFSLLPENKEK
jgi:hypothetical protein